jgi:hypothetical protein
MKKPQGAGTAHSPHSVHERTNDRLVKPLYISKKMRPFVERMRLGIKNLDLSDPATASQFERNRQELKRILVSAKILSAKIEHVIEQTLDAAVDHRLQGMRQEDRRRDRLRSKDSVERLIERLTELAAAIAKLPPIAKKQLNAIVANHTEQFFDTETFVAIINDFETALPKLAPIRRAQDAFDVIDQPIPEITRTAPPEIIGLWEIMSAGTRQQIELKIRRAVPKKSAIEFLGQLVVLLKCFLPRSKAGRRTIQRRYVERVGKIWQSLGLRVGRAYDGIKGRSVESRFQRYCRLALAAVGDSSQISGRQIVVVNNDLRKRPDGRVKRLK